VVVNRVHPSFPGAAGLAPTLDGTGHDGHELLRWLGERDRESVSALRSLLGGTHPLVEVPLLPDEPTDLESLAALGGMLGERFDDALGACRA
jgi:hypothetical protein